MNASMKTLSSLGSVYMACGILMFIPLVANLLHAAQMTPGFSLYHHSHRFNVTFLMGLLMFGTLYLRVSGTYLFTPLLYMN